MIALILATVLAADLAAVKGEVDPKKRAEKAFDFALQQLADARSAADASDFDKVETLAPTIADAVDVASEALTSGKKNIGRLKNGEKRCNDLLRRLETFRQDLPVDERSAVEATIKRVHSVQERFLSLVLDRGK